MITCTFEDGGNAKLRHVAADAIAINDNNQILLTRRSEKISRPNKYALPGGYLDRNENIHNAVIRELEEETGFTGEVQFLFAINDNTDENTRKDDRQTVALIFVVKVTGGEIRENSEVSEIKWFDKDNLPADDAFAFDHRHFITRYFEYLDGNFQLPIFAKDSLEL